VGIAFFVDGTEKAKNSTKKAKNSKKKQEDCITVAVGASLIVSIRDRPLSGHPFSVGSRPIGCVVGTLLSFRS
jgi:hypothetical protein